MKRLLLLSFLFSLITSPLLLHPQENKRCGSPKSVCLIEAEQELATLINEYRAEKGLSQIELSSSLSYVAQVHAQDLLSNKDRPSRCNLHSWSDKGDWTSCCYTPDHKQSECMWNKPAELTDYPGLGYEIAYFTTSTFNTPLLTAQDILNAWKGSSGHNAVIMNEGIWRSVSWKAMGIGIYKGYATVWFGKEKDPVGIPDLCH
jgi:hypothetical protein